MSKMINLSSKTEFIHLLIYHEVIGRRLPAILAFKKGLSILGVDSLLCDHKVLHTSSLLNSERLLKLIEWRDVNEENQHTKEFFTQYLMDKTGKLVTIIV